jgi:hypothetical protein
MRHTFGLAVIPGKGGSKEIVKEAFPDILDHG